MLRDKIYWLGHPYLLYEKVSTNTKLLQTSLESLRIGAEESFHDDVILDRNILAGVRLRHSLRCCSNTLSSAAKGPVVAIEVPPSFILQLLSAINAKSRYWRYCIITS